MSKLSPVLDYQALDYKEALYCRVTLAKDWKIELAGNVHRQDERLVRLTHKRDARTPMREVILEPGKSKRMMLERAEDFFGKFSIPILRLADRATESQKKRLAADYAMTVAHCIVRWGDYPRLALAGAGMTYNPVGPARFPDIHVAIEPSSIDEEDPKDVRWRTYSLRELYKLEKYVDCEHLVNPNGWENRQLAEQRAEKRSEAEDSLKAQIASIQAQNDMLMKLLGPGVQEQLAKVLAQSEGAPKVSVPA